LPLLASVVVTALVALKAARPQADGFEDGLAPLYAIYAMLGGAGLLAEQTYLACEWWQWPSAPTWQAGATFVSAGLCAVTAWGGFALGLRARSVAMRGSALLVVALATAVMVWADT